ncbi:hypothetical protein HPB51_018032 [Rhipicephalus microplus]|uniref:Uncharacterized protein n=1 Tax=Rhipicephalus microplus TaxID=6941 RepID=A0A9J6DNJ7_RHIMP|nr:hypothetical protein HPB51_018032 [Rhipicephalus microplus]
MLATATRRRLPSREQSPAQASLIHATVSASELHRCLHEAVYTYQEDLVPSGSAAELEDGTWVTPKTTQGGLDPLDMQHKYRMAGPKPSKAMPELASTPALVVQAAHPPQLPRRRPMPRLPSEHYKIVVRPRHTMNLSNIGLATLTEAIQNTAKVDPAQAEEEDQIRIHPIKNTLTVSTPDRIWAEAYRSLEVLRRILGTAQICARCPALEYQNAEDMVENIPRRHWENSQHVHHSV